jgi:hypothetical protein
MLGLKKRCRQCRRRVKVSRRYQYNTTHTAVDIERHRGHGGQCPASGVNLRPGR